MESSINFSLIMPIVISGLASGLIAGLLLFPSPDFSKSILVGIVFPTGFFPEFVECLKI